MSVTSVGVGLGVTLGVLAVVALVLVAVGLCTSQRRTRDVENEMTRRRDVLRERHEREQRQWRERRLRDVVIVLIERGEACEGVPLAFQVAGHNEVPARRRLRNARRGAPDPVLQSSDEEERALGLDAESAAIARKPLAEHLANGRPEDAEPAPDLMQLLLDGEELRNHDSASSTDNEAEFMSINTETEASFTPATSHSPQPESPPPASASELPSALVSATADPRAQRQREREDALIKKLHAEKQQRGRRRKTAEEVYGQGTAYLRNPNNDAYVQVREESVQLEEPRSPFMRFLSPLTPFRGRRKKQSAFDGAEPPDASPTRRPRRGSENREGVSTDKGPSPPAARCKAESHASMSSEPY